MPKILLTIFLSLALVLTACVPSSRSLNQESEAATPISDAKTFGANFNYQPWQVMSLQQAMEKAEENKDKTIYVSGQIHEVCEVMGCWLTLNHPTEIVRVRFTASEDCAEGFYVPRNAHGHRTVLAGTLTRTQISEDWARHYAEDKGATPEEIAKIVGPQDEYFFLATGIKIADATSLDEPVR